MSLVALAAALLRLVNALVARADAEALRKAGRDGVLADLYVKGLESVSRASDVDRAVDGDDPDWVRRVRERYSAR